MLLNNLLLTSATNTVILFFIHPGVWQYFQTPGWVKNNITVFVALVSNKLFNNNSNAYLFIAGNKFLRLIFI